MINKLVVDICSDKTGTLTQGKMVVKRAWIPSKGTYAVGTSENPIDPTMGNLFHNETEPRKDEDEGRLEGVATSYEELLEDNDALEEFLTVAALANLANVHNSEGEWKARGDPTEIAIQVFASRFNWNRIRWTSDTEYAIWKQRAEYPFDSSIKIMSVVFETESESMVFTKGAVERVLECCTTVILPNGKFKLSQDIRNQILENMEALASQGLRVLALASKELPGPYELNYRNFDVEKYP